VVVARHVLNASDCNRLHQAGGLLNKLAGSSRLSPRRFPSQNHFLVCVSGTIVPELQVCHTHSVVWEILVTRARGWPA